MIHELDALRDRTRVFRDRAHAGEVLAEMLGGVAAGGARVLAIPAGGVPVGIAIAGRLGLPLELAVVSKITLPWNSEVGYGAVAFDGSVQLNQALIAALGLREAEIRRGIELTEEKVRRRIASLGGCASTDPSAPALLVDDGLASGFTMRTAVAALARSGARGIAVAVPTGSRRAVEALAPSVEELYCANVRGAGQFAVADAYERWSDVDEGEVAELLASLTAAPGARPRRRERRRP